MGFYLNISIIFVLVLLLIDLLIRFLIAVYMYRDSKKRDMNALLWVLIALFTPIFVGLVIYLIIRQLDGKTKCTRCGTFVKRDFSNCPNCGLILKKTCPLCGKKVDPNWITCGWCGEKLTNESMESSTKETN